MLDCAPSYGLLLKYEDQHLWGTPGKQHKQQMQSALEELPC